MTCDDIIKLAHQAQFESFGNGDWVCTTEEIETFAALVAAHERSRLQSAAECFRMCEHKGVCDEKAKSNEAN